ncbi:MAG: ChaN family lipoprotein [Proteobacteria bacterium]|nr:ChaN family lipoprotein [Pseudomonadota bacterium]
MLNRRTLLAAGPAAALAGCAALRPAPPPSTATPTPDAAARLDAALRARPLVLLGEVHDNAAQHTLRAEALHRWLARSGARPALLMEQFDRERQPALDAVLAQPGATVDALIAAGWPDGRAGWDWALYRPYLALVFEFALPLVAANVSRADARRIGSDGLAAHGFDAAVPDDVLRGQQRAIVDGHCGQASDTLAARLAHAQIARDQFMARQLARHAGRGAVLLAGNGHVRRDIGVPRWLPAALQRGCTVVGLLEAPPAAAEQPAYDVKIVTEAPATRGDPCAAFGGRAPA